MLYWDTSAILPLYVEEASSKLWDEAAGAETGALFSSQLSMAEMAFALKQKVLRKEIGRRAAEGAQKRFARDLESGFWHLVPLGIDVIKESAEMAGTCYGLRSPVPLRTLDGLHLSCARLSKCRTVATGDRRLAEAARVLGFDVLEPGAPG